MANERILIVEDEKKIADLLKDYLSRRDSRFPAWIVETRLPKP